MLQNKKFTILVSVVLAIFLWVYVITVENPSTKVKIPNVPIQVLNIESLSQRGLALTSSEPYFMDITIEGKRADVLKISANDVTATIDVFGYSVGENNIPVTVTVPDSVSLADQKTKKLPIVIEELVSVYKPVVVIFQGQIWENLEATVFDITPEEVEVKGAKSQVASVHAVNATVDATMLTGNVQTFTSELVTMDSNGQPINSVKLSADSAEIDAAVYEIKEVPLEVNIIGEVNPAYQVTDMVVPDKIKIKGLASSLKNVDSVQGAEVDISNVIATTDIPISINLPDGVMPAQEAEDIAVSITIKGITVKEFEIDSGAGITANGLGEKLSLVINTQSVNVKVSGKEAVVSALTAEDIGLFINLEGLEAGVYTVPLGMNENKNLSEIIVTPGEVHITINEAV